jgi:hypothetical protein
MHLSSTRTGLKVDADNIPELGGFLSRDFGSKYYNLFIKTPCLIRPFSEFLSMVAIDKFDCIYITNCLMSKFRNTSVLGGHWIYKSCFQILFKIPGYQLFYSLLIHIYVKTKVLSTFRTFSRIS